MTEWAPRRCVVVGSSGGLGGAFVEQLCKKDSVEQIECLSRSGAVPFENQKLTAHECDYNEPGFMDAIVKDLQSGEPIDLVIVATGLLHAQDGFGPEKSLRDLDAERLARAYHINAVGPAMVAKALLPLMRRDEKSVFAAISARVGSISDNHIGGWYGYRAAKAALNQLLRTASIEHARRWPDGIVLGLHPGTVDTRLSEPFQRNVADGKLFTPEHSAARMLEVIDRATRSDTGKVIAYDGQAVPA